MWSTRSASQAWSPYPLLGGGSRQRIRDVYSTAQSAKLHLDVHELPGRADGRRLHRRNVGQLDLRLYEEIDEDDREPRPDHPAALSMRYPNETTPADQFIRSLFLDFLVYDNAYALIAPAAERQLSHVVAAGASGWNCPASSIFDAENYRFHNPQNGTYADFTPDQILHWRGENPHDHGSASRSLETLRKVVAEDAALQQANVELANCGMQKPVWVFRPLEAPEWSPEARSGSRRTWNRLRQSTDMPAVLEEGMELRDFGVSPNDAEALDVRQWLLAEVAQAYGVPGPMVGLDGDLEKAQQSFYADTLPPYCEEFTRVLNHLLLVREYGETDSDVRVQPGREADGRRAA